jgi:hypothetical protein
MTRTGPQKQRRHRRLAALEPRDRRAPLRRRGRTQRQQLLSARRPRTRVRRLQPPLRLQGAGRLSQPLKPKPRHPQHRDQQHNGANHRRHVTKIRGPTGVPEPRALSVAMAPSRLQGRTHSLRPLPLPPSPPIRGPESAADLTATNRVAPHKQSSATRLRGFTPLTTFTDRETGAYAGSYRRQPGRATPQLHRPCRPPWQSTRVGMKGGTTEYPQRDSNPRYRRERPAS